MLDMFDIEQVVSGTNWEFTVVVILSVMIMTYALVRETVRHSKFTPHWWVCFGLLCVEIGWGARIGHWAFASLFSPDLAQCSVQMNPEMLKIIGANPSMLDFHQIFHSVDIKNIVCRRVPYPDWAYQTRYWLWIGAHLATIGLAAIVHGMFGKRWWMAVLAIGFPTFYIMAFAR